MQLTYTICSQLQPSSAVLCSAHVRFSVQTHLFCFQVAEAVEQFAGLKWEQNQETQVGYLLDLTTEIAIHGQKQRIAVQVLI